MKYFLASVYQQLKTKRPDGTPYFNLCGIIVALFVVNLLTGLVAIKVWLHKDYIARSANAFLGWGVFITICIVLFTRVLLPSDVIKNIEIDQRDAKRNYWLLFSYLFLSLFMMMVVMFQLRVPTPSAP